MHGYSGIEAVGWGSTKQLDFKFVLQFSGTAYMMPMEVGANIVPTTSACAWFISSAPAAR